MVTIKQKRILQLFALSVVIAIAGFFIVQIQVGQFADSIVEVEQAQPAQVALVLGARVYKNNQPSDILSDRLDTAIALYENGTVEKLLLSGDNGQEEYDEVNVMREYVLDAGIDPEDVFLDHAGFDTYDSIYRAKQVFLADSAILVTQDFHLPRALYIAAALELDAQGVSADKQHYVNADYQERREKLARIKAYYNVLANSKPRFSGGVYPLTEDGRITWDEDYAQ